VALFGQRAPAPSATSTLARPNLRVLRADGARIDLSRRDAGTLLVATRQPWQTQAWAYRDLIGELRYALQLRAHAVARCRFYIAEVRPWPEDPVPLDSNDTTLDSQLIADAIHNFGLIPFDHEPDGFTARFDENFGVAGETWVHVDSDTQFHVRSTSEVTASADGRVVINQLPTAVAGSQRQLNPETESLLRCWRPHPEWGQLADSAMRALLDVCEDAVLAGREQRAAARSRVAANGLLLIPESLSLVQERQDEEDDDGVLTDTFMQDLTAAMLAPIRDDGDASAVVPIVLRGGTEELEKVRHLSLQREDPEQVLGRQQAALQRILKGLDVVQPEQVEGIATMNHWGSWQLDARSIRDHVIPAAESMVASLMQAWIRPALESLGHSAQDINRIMIAVDPSPLAENPNRGQDARDAHAAFVISDEALRTSLGFDDDDAPTEDEKLYRLAVAGRLTPQHTALVVGIQQPGSPITIEAETMPQQRGLPAGTGDRPQAGPGIVTPTDPVPQEPPQVVAAAVHDEATGYVVDDEAGRRLADIDAALADRITVAADAALARVIERAGARVRSQAQKDRALAASVKGMDAHLIPAQLGRERVEAFVPVADLLADGYQRLRGQVTRWLGEGAAQVADVVVGLLKLRGAQADRVRVQVTDRLSSRTDAAWQTLADRLDAAAEVALFRADPLTPDPGPGEPVDTLIAPADVEDALRVAGGGRPVRESSHTHAPRLESTPGPGGYGTGPDVTAILAEHGALLLGWEWQYRFGIRRDHPFAPWHTELDGVRFATFTDPVLDTTPQTAWVGPYFFPQDHQGCRCRAAPVLAVVERPDPDDDIVARRLREAAADPRNRLADEVAAEDTAAGRVGTSLQQESEVRRRLIDQHIRGANQ
jgi:hypothetical protein